MIEEVREHVAKIACPQTGAWMGRRSIVRQRNGENREKSHTTLNVRNDIMNVG